MVSSGRDWSELPLDALASVFGKLGPIEILMGAGLVCRSWLQAAKQPELWRSVHMDRHKAVGEMDDGDLRAMARAAVDRSGGQLQVFVGKRFVTDHLLEYIAARSPALKSLSLISCDGVGNRGLTELAAKCPLLEDLLLVLCHNVAGRDVYEAVGGACAQLRRFWLRTSPFRPAAGETLGVAAMRELRTLGLRNSNVANGELACILDACPHLQRLDLTDCFHVVVDDALRARCAGIESVVFPDPRKAEEYWSYYWDSEPLSSRDVDFGGDSD